jgi:hypothetical protein
MGKEMTETEEISRVSRSKAAARASYDRMSSWYDWMAGSSEKAFTDLGLELLCVKPGEHVLEIGCGTGQSLPADFCNSLTGAIRIPAGGGCQTPYMGSASHSGSGTTGLSQVGDPGMPTLFQPRPLL